MKPLARNEKPEEFGDLRPISLLSVFSKIFEKLVHKQVYMYLEERRMISPFPARIQEKTINGNPW